MDAIGPQVARPFVAVAASGGRDSLALALLMRDWVLSRKGRLIVLTVDHGLRKGSGAEAQKFARQMAALGIDCKILRWRGAKPATGIQEAARDKRYSLLLGECKKRGVTHLALAHQEEDQAETLLIRLLGGSGLDGLCAMRPLTQRAGVALIRPLLGVPRARLEATCKKHRQAWIDDPANENLDFRRVRVRDFLAGEGPDAARRVALAASKLSRVREWIADEVQRALESAYDGNGTLDLTLWRGLAPEIQGRVLVLLTGALSAKPYPPRQEKLDALVLALQKSGFKGRTLGGCIFGAEKKNKIFITRE